MSEPVDSPLIPPDGRQSEAASAIARGTFRLLATLDMAGLSEVTLASGRRADIMALARDGEVWIVEIKSGLSDFRSDAKWPEYRAWCDRLLFAVAADFPLAALPDDVGVIMADRFGAAVLREAPVHPLAPARRKAVTLAFARTAAGRLQSLLDPTQPFERLVG